MNKMFVIGLFGGLGTFIYYCFVREKINKNRIIKVNFDETKNEIINNKEESNKDKEESNKGEQNESKEIIIKNEKISDIISDKVNLDDIISKEVKKIIDVYVDNMINNEIKKQYQLIVYEKPKSLFELYLDDYWEIM